MNVAGEPLTHHNFAELRKSQPELFEDCKTEKLDVAGEMSVPQGAELHKPAEMGAPTIQLPKDAATIIEVSQGKDKLPTVAGRKCR